MAFKLTPGNTDDRQPVPDMTQDIIGKLFGDRGYISQELGTCVILTTEVKFLNITLGLSEQRH